MDTFKDLLFSFKSPKSQLQKLIHKLYREKEYEEKQIEQVKKIAKEIIKESLKIGRVVELGRNP